MMAFCKAFFKNDFFVKHKESDSYLFFGTEKYFE